MSKKNEQRMKKFFTEWLGSQHSPQNIPRNECCCCEQPISKQQKKNLLLFDWMLTTSTFVPWDILWTMVMFDPT